MTQSTIVKRGIAHVFASDIPLDEGFIPFEMAIQRITDPEQLIPELFKSIDPRFHQRVKPGDIVFAGSNFACGKPHVQGFIALAALDCAIVCQSMPTKNLRRAIARGLPVITGSASISHFLTSGDEVEINFSTGKGINHTRGTQFEVPAMPRAMLDIVISGGEKGALRAWLQAHPEQALNTTQLTQAALTVIPINAI